MNVNELRTNRAKAWEAAKNFLDSHRNENGMLSLEDTKTYEEMEAKIVNLGKEIERQERMDAMEREMAMPVNTPITTKPETQRWMIRRVVHRTPTRRLSGVQSALSMAWHPMSCLKV